MTKRQVVTALRDIYPVQMLCEIVELASSTYYYQPTGQDDLSLLVLVEDVILENPIEMSNSTITLDIEGERYRFIKFWQ